MAMKFRVWHPVTGMTYLFPPAMAVRGRSLSIVFTNNFYDLWHSEDKIERKEIDEYVVMAFSGSKDKNGKDIYEGDMYSRGNIVEFSFGSFNINGDTPLNAIASRIEIIGNKYENPELKL